MPRGKLYQQDDSWSLVRAEANGNGFPLLLLNCYFRGVLYVWTKPDNFADLCNLPPELSSAIKMPPHSYAVFAPETGRHGATVPAK